MNFDFRLPQTDAVLSALRPYGHKRILNVTCGNGINHEQLGDLCPATATAIAAGQEKLFCHCPNYPRIVQAEPFRLPFPTEYFDALLCPQLIDHLENPDERRLALEEMARVIRPEGRLVITVLHQNFRFDRFGIPKQGAPEGIFYHRYYLEEFKQQLARRWRIESICGVWSYLPKTYCIYTRLGKYVVYWERVLRRLPLSLYYGKMLLAVCSRSCK